MPDGDELRVVLGDMLRELVDDVRFARGVRAPRAAPRAHESGSSSRACVLLAGPTYAGRIRATRFSAEKNALQLLRCDASIFCPPAVRR